jgi:hypothetical protein
MKRYRISNLNFSMLFSLSLVIAACGSKPTGTAPIAGPTGTVLALVGPNGGHVLTMTQLKALPITEGQGGIKAGAANGENYQNSPARGITAHPGSSSGFYPAQAGATSR